MVRVTGPGASALVSRGPAAVQHVSPSGNDAGSGLSWYEAKLTVKAAVDALPASGGRVEFMDGVWAQADHSKGLWFSAAAPQIAAGWIAPKALHLLGVPGPNSGGTPFGYPSRILTPSTVASKLFQATSSMVWENVYLVADVACRIQVTDDGVRLHRTPEQATSNKLFLNCRFRANQVAGAGPVVDVGDLAFWMWWIGCSFDANEQELMASDKRCCVLSDPTAPGAPLGIATFRDCNFNGGGGVRLRTGGTGGLRLRLDGCVTEGSSTGAVPGSAQPLLELISVGTAYNGAVIVEQCEIADSPNRDVAVRIDPKIPASSTIILGLGVHQDVQGPATIIDGATVAGSTPALEGQVGLFGLQLEGRHDSARRAFGPVAVRFPNLAPQSTTTWAAAAGSATVTGGIAAPDGTTGAGRLSSTGYNERQIYRATRTVTVDDWVIGGVWARAAALPPVNGSLAVGLTGSGYTFALNATATLSASVPTSVLEWVWLVVGSKVATVGGGVTDLIIGLRADTAKPCDYYGPVLIHLPAGTVSDAEAADMLRHLASYPNGAAAGDLATLPGQKLYVGGRPTVTGSRGSNAALASLLTQLAAQGLIVDGSS